MRATYITYKEKSEDKYTFIAGYKGSFDKLRRDAEEHEKIQRKKMEERERERREQIIKINMNSEPQKK